MNKSDFSVCTLFPTSATREAVSFKSVFQLRFSSFVSVCFHPPLTNCVLLTSFHDCIYLVKVKWKIYVQSDAQTNWIRFPPFYAKNVIWCKTFVFPTRSVFHSLSMVFGPHMRKKCATTTLSIHPQNAIWIIWCFMLLLSAVPLCASEHRNPECKNITQYIEF